MCDGSFPIDSSHGDHAHTFQQARVAELNPLAAAAGKLLPGKEGQTASDRLYWCSRVSGILELVQSRCGAMRNHSCKMQCGEMHCPADPLVGISHHRCDGQKDEVGDILLVELLRKRSKLKMHFESLLCGGKEVIDQDAHAGACSQQETH